LIEVLIMPFQAGKCDGCGEIDYLREIKGYWLCKYCFETLIEDKEITLTNNKVLRLEES